MSKLSNVPNGAEVLVEIGRDTNGVSPNWSKPFKDTLYIQRHNGIPCGLALNATTFAEFDPRRDSEGEVGDVEFHSEDYILRILQINGVKVAESANSPDQQASLQEEVSAFATSALIEHLRCQGALKMQKHSHRNEIMSINSDRRAVIDLAQKIASESPAMANVDAAAQALRQFYSLTSIEGIWGGSEAANCMGYVDKSSDEDLFERIARDVGRMVIPTSKNGLLDTDQEGTLTCGLQNERPRGPHP